MSSSRLTSILKANATFVVCLLNNLGNSVLTAILQAVRMYLEFSPLPSLTCHEKEHDDVIAYEHALNASHVLCQRRSLCVREVQEIRSKSQSQEV